jgi:tRNA(fMet)-specific endonuclease VapC
MRYILDTNILLHIIRESPTFDRLIKPLDLFNGTNKVVISAVSVGELLSISQQNEWGVRKKSTIENLVNSLQIIPIQKRILLNAYADIDTFSQGRHSSKSLPEGTNSARNMGKNDLWIAATAHLLEAVLITTDNDFDHLKDIYFGIEKIII